jgi:hypothetical protein
MESKLGPLGTSATEWHIVPAPGDYDDGEFGGMKIGRGNRSTRRKPAPAPLCSPQIPLDQTQARSWTSAVGSQRLTAWAVARPGTNIRRNNILQQFFNSRQTSRCHHFLALTSPAEGQRLILGPSDISV